MTLTGPLSTGSRGVINPDVPSLIVPANKVLKHRYPHMPTWQRKKMNVRGKKKVNEKGMRMSQDVRAVVMLVA